MTTRHGLGLPFFLFAVLWIAGEVMHHVVQIWEAGIGLAWSRLNDRLFWLVDIALPTVGVLVLLLAIALLGRRSQPKA